MNYTDEQMDEIAALDLSQAQKRRVLELLDLYGDEMFWVGRYAESLERGGSSQLVITKNHHHDQATQAREQLKAILFPNGGE